jgi:hypothetical protein
VSELIDPLRGAAERHGTVLVSSEAFAWLFAEADETFLAALDGLAREHRVRVAYYVRAQDESLEAAWRQWGFRSGEMPSSYLRRRSSILDYHATLLSVGMLAPNVSFEIRRITTNVVDDFLATFLGATRSWDPRGTRANVGLPLALVNTLRFAPEGMFWDTIDDNRRLNRLKKVLRPVEIPEPDALRTARLVLHRYSFDRFGDSNAALATALGWSDRDLVPPPSTLADVTAGQDDLSALDSLWTCQQSERARRELFDALDAALTSEAGEPDAIAAVERFYGVSREISS